MPAFIRISATVIGSMVPQPLPRPADEFASSHRFTSSSQRLANWFFNVFIGETAPVRKKCHPP
ncbi:MAG: hypothetical protein KGQ51_18680, partial [Planctomycetes bacterium]|nr:hypothetical protein [Planctomycetota bacterium]